MWYARSMQAPSPSSSPVEVVLVALMVRSQPVFPLPPPQSEEGDESGGGVGSGGGGGEGRGGHLGACTEASIVKKNAEFSFPGVYTTWLVPVPLKVSVMERLRSSGVRDAAADGSLPSVPSPLKVLPARTTFVSEERDAV